jgi:iron complex outermembrane receptor protein
VPFSINAQTEEDIQRSGAVTLEDLSRNVAGLAIQNLGPGQSQVSIRGVSSGQIVRDQPGVKEQVGVYLDETAISMSLFTPDLDLFDLKRVETLRGPQGTLYGSGNIGGTIRYITNEARLRVSEGSVEANVNTIADGGTGGGLKAAVNVPMGDAAAMRLVAYGTHFGGWTDALGPGGGKDVNKGDRTGGRVSFTFQPNQDLTITPRLVYQKVTADGFNREEKFNLYANPYTPR